MALKQLPCPIPKFNVLSKLYTNAISQTSIAQLHSFSFICKYRFIRKTFTNKINIRQASKQNQPYKMVQRTQTICRQELTNCLGVFDHFMGLVFKGLEQDLNKNTNILIIMNERSFYNLIFFCCTIDSLFGEREQKITAYKSNPSNLSVVRTK